MEPSTVYLALGSNLGDRRANLIDAISQLRQKVTIEQLSSVYETEPAYVTDQPRFYNMVLRGRTELSPPELLHFVQSIERRMGRVRVQRYGPRPIDLDILAYDTLQQKTPDLTIPHPRIAERAFVLEPFAEIGPNFTLPDHNKQVVELLEELGEEAQGAVLKVLQKPTMHFRRDLQKETPPTHLSLTHVGVTGIKRIVRLRGKKSPALFYAEMDLYVELRPDQKGAHMSRFSDTVEEIIAKLSRDPVSTLESLAGQVAEEVLHNQEAIRSDVHIRAPVPQHRYAPVSAKATQEIYTLIGIAAATQTRMVRLVGVEAEGMMTSPSAQEMMADHTRERLLEAGFEADQIDKILQIVPVASHNQRGRGTLIVGTDQIIQAEDLVNIVEGAMSSENYDLLKRPDELFIVAKAHRHPRFVEDAVREMIFGLIELYPTLADETFVLARQLNIETIHKHDIYAERVGTLGELRQEIDQSSYVTPHTTLDAWLRHQLNHQGQPS
jgi:GTP cyclohydrolase-4